MILRDDGFVRRVDESVTLFLPSTGEVDMKIVMCHDVLELTGGAV